MKYKELWEAFYKEKKYIMWFPGEVAIKFFGRVSKDICINGKYGLDFGCGVGRNTYFMDCIGLYAYGIDISEKAIEIGNEHFGTPYLRVYDGEIIPFNDNYFDFVISHGVLDHVLFDKAKDLMKEIHRVSKPNGLVELEIHSIYDSRYEKGRKIDKNTFIIEDDCEKGIPQHYFDRMELKELIEGFELKELFLNGEVSIDKNITTSFWVLYLEVIK